MAFRFAIGLLPAVGVVVLSAPSGAQCLDEIILPESEAEGGHFGYSVALHGSTAVIGAPKGGADGLGRVVIHELFDDRWLPVQTLVAPISPMDMEFGWSVGISDSWLLVGAPRDDTAIPRTGAAYLFKRNGLLWSFHQKLHGGQLQTNDRFGNSVAINDLHLVVGAPYHAVIPVFGPGPGEVFKWSSAAGLWHYLGGMFFGGYNGVHLFGHAAAIEGTRVAIGAPLFWGQVLGGAAYVLDIQDASVWSLFGQVAPPYSGHFGWAVGLSGDTLFIGSPAHDGSGAVQVFEHDASAIGPPTWGPWKRMQLLHPIDAKAGMRFGASIALSGDDALIGADGKHDGKWGAGAAYHFRRIDGSWVQIGKLLSTDPQANDYFGISVALDGSTALVGAYLDDDACTTVPTCSAGAAHVYLLAPDAEQFCSCPSSGVCGNGDDHGGCKNSTGQGAVLAACGSGSVGADDLATEARWLPANQLAIAIMGSTAAAIPLGDGQLCVAAGNTGVFRFAPQDSGSRGVATFGPGIVAYTHANFPPSGQIQPGQTWYFQTWYRDPAGWCGTGFNLTNGLKVEFKP